MDDVRVQWLGERLQSAFNIKTPSTFEELLSRNDGEEADTILRFLNRRAGPDEGAASALLFRLEQRLDEIEVEVEVPYEEHSDEEEERPSAASSAFSMTDTKKDRKSKSSLPETLGRHQSSMGSLTSGLSDIERELGLAPIRTVKQMIKEEVYNLYYHVALDNIPEEFVDSEIVFFLRDTTDLATANAEVQRPQTCSYSDGKYPQSWKSF